MIRVREKLKEYLRLGRLFNAEILSLILILSYMLSAKLHGIDIDTTILIMLFVSGIFAHVWGGYNNDRFDLIIDKKAKYCSHKPLVSGSISIKNAKVIEFTALFIFIMLALSSSYISHSSLSPIVVSPRIPSTIFFVFCAFFLAYVYNRFNKSNMFINIVGQMYASFVVLVGMSVVIDFDFIIFLSAVVMGLNGVYLNIIEADLKDVKGDIINVPKTLGVRFVGKKAVNTLKFYILNEIIKTTIFVLILIILLLERANIYYSILACIIFAVNYFVRIFMFKNLSSNREETKRYIAIQELTAILLISTIYMIINPFLPIIVLVFVALWLSIWNKILWNTYTRPQV